MLIVDSSRETTDMINTIAAATEQQSVIITEMSKDMGKVVQSADGILSESEQVKKVSMLLSEMVDTLNKEMSQFKIE